MVLDEGDITNVAVRPDRQKEGIGHFLMDSLIRLAEQQGVTTIHLEVRTGNGTAIRLYERMGFTKDGIRKKYYTDPVEDALLMTRHGLSQDFMPEPIRCIVENQKRKCHKAECSPK